MAKKNKTVKELNVDFFLLAERVTKLEDAIEKSETLKTSERKIKLLEDNLKAYDDKIKDLENMLNKSKEKVEGLEHKICKDCGESVKCKSELKEHIKKSHQRLLNVIIVMKHLQKAGKWRNM